MFSCFAKNTAVVRTTVANSKTGMNNAVHIHIPVFVVKFLKAISVFSVLQVKIGVASNLINLLEIQQISILGYAKYLHFFFGLQMLCV